MENPVAHFRQRLANEMDVLALQKAWALLQPIWRQSGKAQALQEGGANAQDHCSSKADKFSIDVAWVGKQPLLAGRRYKLLAVGGSALALAGKLKYRMGEDSREHAAATRLTDGEVGRVELELDFPIIFQDDSNPGAYSLVALLDEISGAFLGLGVIRFALRRASNIRWQQLRINRRERAAALGQKPFVLWLTGLSGSGKSSVAAQLEERLFRMGRHTYVLDGDNVRHGLCVDLGFTEADRVENMRRVTEVAKLMVDAGLIVIVSFISPFRHERLRARQSFGDEEFLEVFVDTPLTVCEARDVKGLYAKARAGLIRNFTGIDSPYEPPESPDIHLHGDSMSPEEMVDVILGELRRRHLLEPSAGSAVAPEAG